MAAIDHDLRTGFAEMEARRAREASRYAHRNVLPQGL